METPNKRKETTEKALTIIEKAVPGRLQDYQKELIIGILESVFDAGNLDGFKEAIKQVEEIGKKDEEIEEEAIGQYTPEQWELEGLGDLV